MHKTNQIFFFSGDNLFNIEQCIKQVISDSGCSDVEKTILDSEESIENLFLSLTKVPLFIDEKILEVSLNNKALKILENEIEKNIEIIKSSKAYKSIILLFYLPKFDSAEKKQLKESNFLSAFSKIATVEEHLKPNYWQTAQIKTYILSIAVKYQLEFTSDAIELFVEALKERLDDVPAELERLKIYLLPTNQITPDVVRKFYLTNASLEDLYNRFISKDFNSIFGVVDSLVSSYSPLYLIAALQNKLRTAYKIKVLSVDASLSSAQISKIIDMHSYRVELELKKIGKTNVEYLSNCLSLLSDIEYRIKTGVVNVNQSLYLFASMLKCA